MSEKNNIDPVKLPGQQSPLVQIDLSLLNQAEGIELSEKAFLGHLNLRGNTDDKAFVKAVESVLGAELPAEANTFTVAKNLTIYWLGPDEWLLLTAANQQSALEQKLRKKLADLFFSVTDVSCAQTIIALSGDNARALLSKACTIDLHPRQFKAGDCVQTLLAKTGVLISQTDDSPSYEIIVRRSFADYLGLWLQDAVDEFID